MNATELQKVLAAGFTAVEVRSNHTAKPLLTIWQKTPDRREWHLREQKAYTSKAACKRVYQEILKDKKIIDLYDCLHNQL